MKVLSLLRVSTEDQSVDSQRAQVEAWAAREGLVVDYRVEDGVSGVSAKRPVLDQAVAELEKGDVLVTVALDRLGRSTLRVVGLLDELYRRGVRVVSLREALDMATPFGKFAAVILAAVAELERGMIVERTKRGLVAARRRGSKLGRREEPWPPEALARLREMKAAGMTAREIWLGGELRIEREGRLVAPGRRSVARRWAAS